MEKMKYGIGRLDIDPARIEMSEGEKTYRQKLIDAGRADKIGRHRARHKFIVASNLGCAMIYVVTATSHALVAGKFDIPDERIVGGGNCWINDEEELILDDFSEDYGAIPKASAQIFGELMLPELQITGLRIRRILANPNENELNSFWKEV